MNTTRFFAAALVLLSVLSCQKEEQPVTGNAENEGGAIITCTFANNDAATKTTTTNGRTPLWAADDVIKIYDAANSANTKAITLIASGTPTADQGLIAADSRSFTFTKPDGWSSDICAIYPASAFVAFDGNDAKICFAGQDGTFAKANICAAKTSTTTLSFKNVGAILKFTSKSVKAAKVVVPVAGLVNDFKVSFSGADPSLASETASNSNEFSIGSSSGVIYVGVPSGTIAASSVFTYKTSSDATLGTYTTGAANTVEVNKVYNLGAMMGVLPGIFTVADGTQVQFSQGNLYYTGSEFKFESNQYDSQPTSNGEYSLSHVSHFRWAKNSGNLSGDISSAISADEELQNKAYIDFFFTNATETAPRADFTATGSTGLWRSLANDEWIYLLNTRKVMVNSTSTTSYGQGTVNGKHGLIILPDNWDGSVCSGFTYGTSGWSNVFTESTTPKWSEMEAAGCVFLPTAGYRSGSTVNDTLGGGYYWSSENAGFSRAYHLLFYADNVVTSSSTMYYRESGRSVRLVCAAQ